MSLNIQGPNCSECVTYDNRLLPNIKSVNPLHNCQYFLPKLDLLDRYGLDVEFDSGMGDGSDRNELKFKVINAWSAQEGLSYKTGNFSVSVNSPTSDLVAMVALPVISVKKSSNSAASQRLVVVKPPTTITQQQQSCLVPSPLQPPPASLVKNVPELGRMAVFDCEWYRDDLKENREKGIAGNIYAFCLVDGHGNSTSIAY